jgi:biopolymer transport protein ExbD
MRRFSQRNSLVTLNEINITPLLDLAFVLLIIFVITRPLMENSINLNPPIGGAAQGRINAKDYRRIEITSTGTYRLDGTAMTLSEIEAKLAAVFKERPNSVVYIRADENDPFRYVNAVLDMCQRRGITRIAIANKPPK